MSGQKRYEQLLNERLHEIVLPDEDIAWQHMAKLLKEDDDDTIVVPPVNKGCILGIALIIFTLLLAGWYFLKAPSANLKKDKKNELIVDQSGVNGTVENSAPKVGDTVLNAKYKRVPHIDDTKKYTASGKQLFPVIEKNKNPLIFSDKMAKKTSDKIYKKSLRNSQTGNEKMAQKAGNILGKPNSFTRSRKGKVKSIVSGPQIGDSDNDKYPASKDLQAVVTKDSASKVVSKPPMDSLKNKTSTDSVKEKRKLTRLSQNDEDSINNKKKRLYSYAAGIAMQQGIPLNGESIVPFNYYGRKGSVTDYIPSIYIRLYRQKKWFIQQEFKYGVPQYTKEFIYKTKLLDSTAGGIKNATYTLKKTYYQQLPFSIHYYLKPGWSIGAGIVYERFFSAISREDIYEKLNTGSDSLVGSSVVKDIDKSIFVKNNFQWLVESQYQRKKVSLGMRYAADIKPYIQFTNSITGLVENRRNYSFNVFIRYEFWNSRTR